MRVWNVAFLKANKILERGDVGGGAVKWLISSFRGIRVISSLDALRRPCDCFPETYLKHGLAPVVFSQMVRTLTGFHEAANSTERTSAIGFLIVEYSSLTRVKSTLSRKT